MVKRTQYTHITLACLQRTDWSCPERRAEDTRGTHAGDFGGAPGAGEVFEDAHSGLAGADMASAYVGDIMHARLHLDRFSAVLPIIPPLIKGAARSGQGGTKGRC
jgi:hypothetical protein